MISALLLIPILGVLLILPFNEITEESKNTMKKLALGISLINLIVSIIVWFKFDSTLSGYQFVYEFNQFQFCHLHVGIDGISLYFVLLTTFITPICILSNWDDITIKLKYFLISFLVLETLQIAVFVVLDLFLFYIFFESVLIPLFFIIIIWGGSVNKYRAAFLLFLYTLAGSLFMLLAILFIYQNTGSTDFVLLSLSDIHSFYQKILWLSPSFSKRYMTDDLIYNNLLLEINLSALLFFTSKFRLSNTHYTKHNIRFKEKENSTDLVLYGSNLGSTVKYKGGAWLRRACEASHIILTFKKYCTYSKLSYSFNSRYIAIRCLVF